MEITKQNGNISISADENGAELHSIKYKGTEYLWQCGNAWKRYAPILFPFICSPKNRTYRAGGREYKLPANHGFARDSVFTLFDENDSGVTYEFKSSNVTKQWYPYDFALYVTYTLTENAVEVLYKVKNTGNDDMYFYIGGHPAFICDIEGGKSFLEYEKSETIVQDTPNGSRTVLDGERVLTLTREQFANDVIMKDAPDSKSVTLKKSDGGYVKLTFADSNCIAVWTAYDSEAQFICLEPWTSVPAYADDEFSDIEKKPHAIKLSAGNEFDYRYTIEVGRL